MTSRGNIDPTLRALKSVGRYQFLQTLVAFAGNSGAVYQLLGNIFIGRKVSSHKCAVPHQDSDIPDHLQHLDWNSSDVSFGQCEITISRGNLSDDYEVYPCLFGHDYGFERELSFRTEFDLVCDRRLLGSLTQTFVIMGQGIGAVVASAVSDRFGRKKVLVASQLLLFIAGMAAGLAPSYPTLAALRFAAGAFQQGQITVAVSLTIEWFPAERRSLQNVTGSVLWAIFPSTMALVCYLLRHVSWRHQQFALSCVSAPIALFQLWYLDESLRWLVANGRKKEAVGVLERAARVNNRDLSTVLATLRLHASDGELETLTSNQHNTNDTSTALSEAREVSRSETILGSTVSKEEAIHGGSVSTIDAVMRSEVSTVEIRLRSAVSAAGTTRSNGVSLAEETQTSLVSTSETTTGRAASNGENTQGSAISTGEKSQDSIDSNGKQSQTGAVSTAEKTKKTAVSAGEQTQGSAVSMGETTVGRRQTSAMLNIADDSGASPKVKDSSEVNTVETTLDRGQTKKLTLLDLFRNRRLLFNAAIMWSAWFSCAFCYFTLYMMSTSLHGNRFLNFFLTGLMELIPCFLLYFLVDRVGRKRVTSLMYSLAGVGLITGGVFRIFTEIPALRTLSVVSAMLGMVGASGMFGAVFLVTPELFPTNMRTQATGLSSFVGRLGGMLAPFMTDLADIAVWAPGALIGTLCFFVVFTIHFLPETRGRELPSTIEDIDQWYTSKKTKPNFYVSVAGLKRISTE